LRNHITNGVLIPKEEAALQVEFQVLHPIAIILEMLVYRGTQPIMNDLEDSRFIEANGFGKSGHNLDGRLGDQ
jgi:hypothetical protein